MCKLDSILYIPSDIEYLLIRMEESYSLNLTIKVIIYNYNSIYYYYYNYSVNA